MSDVVHILLIIDDLLIVDAVHPYLLSLPTPVRITRARTVAGARQTLDRESVDLVLLGLQFPDGQATDLIPARRKRGGPSFLIVSGPAGRQAAGALVRAGAADYFIVTPDTLDDLGYVADRILRDRRLEDDIEATLERLRDSEERHQLLVDHFLDIFWTMDLNLRLTEVSPSAVRMHGWTAEEWTKLRPDQFLPPASMAAVGERLARVLASPGGQNAEDSGQLEIEQYRKDGSTFWTEVIYRLVRSADGRPERIVGVTHDISLRKQAELALALEKKRLREIIDLVPHFIFAKDEDGRFTLVNQAVADAYGTSVEAAIGRTDANFARSPEEARQFRADDMEVLRAGVPRIITEEPITDSTGRRRWLMTTKIPFTVTGLSRPHLLGVSVDITERKRSEEERRSFESQLGQAQRLEALGTLAGGIAHDFNNILMAVNGYADLALDRSGVDDGTRGVLEKIRQAGARATELVRQILTFSRPSPQEIRPVRVGPVLQEVLTLLRASLPSTIEIRCDIRADVTVLADPGQIHQVVVNLGTNAGLAMRDGGGLMEFLVDRIELGAEEAARRGMTPGPAARLIARDNGCGMTAEVAGRVFEPFFTTRTDGEGTGLGLAVVHGIVRGHGGSIRVDSTPGVGSEFEILLPAVAAAEEIHPMVLSPTPGGRERILLVDDEVALVELMRELLQSFGYRVTAFHDSLEALSHFEAAPNDFDLVVSDVTMPHLPGDHLAQRVRKLRPGLPVILCTGYSDRVSEGDARSLDVDAVLAKPMALNELAAAVHRVLHPSG